jgi:hypothetical protein
LKFIQRLVPGLTLLMVPGFGGCLAIRHQTDPIEVRPIHVTVDVNVRVDRALDDFFGELDRRSETIERRQDGGTP